MMRCAFGVLALLTACSAAPARDSQSPTIEGRARVLDGDTVSLDFRFSGVDAVESRALCLNASGCYRCGKLAQDATARMLRGKTTSITLIGDESYRRPVAIVSVNGVDIGEHLIAQGWAIPVLRYLRRDPARATRYDAAYRGAVRGRRGIHAGAWIEPARWRRGERLACEQR